MKKASLLTQSLLSILILISCSSGGSQKASEQVPAQLIPPDFVVRQVGGPAYAARHVTGPITVNLEVDVINRSAEKLTVEHIRFETVGEGAYAIVPETRSFEREIAPQQVATLEVWLSGQAKETILGNNGPVTIRGIAYFDSEYGKFQKVFMQQLNDGMKGQRKPQ